MSRELPRRPNLEHLKKQAKVRLEQLRTVRPAAQLAEAQHEIAREYGFASWPRLQAHVQLSAAADVAVEPVAEPSGARDLEPPRRPPVSASESGSGQPLFARFTVRARRALFYSRWEAAVAGSPEIGAEHMLIGLVREREGMPEPKRVALSAADVRSAVTRPVPGQPPLPNSQLIPFDSTVRAICVRAGEIADRLGHTPIATVHLLIGITQDEGSTAARFLADRGVSYDLLLRDVAEGALTPEDTCQ